MENETTNLQKERTHEIQSTISASHDILGLKNLKYSQSQIWQLSPTPSVTWGNYLAAWLPMQHSPPRGVSATRRCFVLRHSAVAAIRPSDFRWPWNGRRKHPPKQPTTRKGESFLEHNRHFRRGKFRGKLMERSQVKQDSLSLIEFKLQKKATWGTTSSQRKRDMFIESYQHTNLHDLHVTRVQRSSHIKWFQPNPDILREFRSRPLGFLTIQPNNQQQSTNHEAQPTTLGWTSPNSTWACNLRPLSIISIPRPDSLKSTLLLVLAAKLRGDSSQQFGRRRSRIHNKDFLPFPESWFFVENGCISNIRFLSFRMISPDPWWWEKGVRALFTGALQVWWFAKTHCHWHQIAQSFHSAETPDIQDVRKLHMRRYLVQSRSKLISFHTLK